MQKRSTVLSLAVGLAGLVTGGVLATSLTANAADSPSTPGSSSTSGTTPPAPPAANGNTDPTKPMRSDEHLLTGTTAAKVTAAVKAKYPGATFQRVESDSDGVYEAHVLVDGKPLTVEVDRSFAVTGTESAPTGRGAGAPPVPGSAT